MASFIELENSPMFYNEVYSIERTSDELKDRCQRLYKGSMKYMAALSEACEGDTTFADSLGSFGGGKDDPLSLSLGGPIISKFVTTVRELATHKELLRSQVEHVLVDRLMHFMSVDLQGAKDSRQLFDKSMHAYDQARDKFVSLKKGTREEILVGLEEELHNSRSAFEASRFNFVNALSNVEAKKKYEFLESFSSIMDAHLRYFKLGYDLLKQMEPFIHQVLTCAHQYKEKANAEQDNLARRIQTFRAQAEMGNLQGPSNTVSTPNVVGIHPLGGETYRDTKTVMQSSVNSEVVKMFTQSSKDISIRDLQACEGIGRGVSLCLTTVGLCTITGPRDQNQLMLNHISQLLPQNTVIVCLVDSGLSIAEHIHGLKRAWDAATLIYEQQQSRWRQRKKICVFALE